LHALLKHPLLDCDLEEAALWYHLRQPAIAERLIDGTDRVMRRVAENPFQFSIRFENCRRAKLAGFPYALYFFVEADSVLLLGLVHTARDAQAALASRRTPLE
jgi:plasmid stabilization system protein ParE